MQPMVAVTFTLQSHGEIGFGEITWMILTNVASSVRRICNDADISTQNVGRQVSNESQTNEILFESLDLVIML